MTATRPFRAFVSYCHVDAKFAGWLQRKLEGYRLPRRLAVGGQQLSGPAPRRIGPVFRDRADLSAAQDLSAAVRQALVASSTLVVVASPDAAKSRWVALEIALFRELHPAAPILVALIRGAPVVALPAVLREGGIEPLAADFRKEGDGKRLALLKIVAGVADVPLDALIQRDAQRQLRRVTAVTLLVAIASIGMAGLLLLTVRAQREAEERRAAAEGLVQYMLTTLRDRLKRGGNLAVMSNVNERALRYFDDQGNGAALSDSSILLRAQILHALAEDEAAKGLVVSARYRLEQAWKMSSAVLQEAPDNADALYVHAQSEFWLGYIGWSTLDLETTRRHWAAYGDLATKLASAEPASARAQLELAYSRGSLCELHMRERSGDAAALALCRQALGFAREALKREPGDSDANSRIRMSLANRLGWLADTLTTQGAYREARELRNEEAIIYKILHKREPASVEIRDRLVWPEIGLAKIELAEGKVARGIARLERCIHDLDRLGDALPDNTIIVGERIRVNILLAKARRDASQPGWRNNRDRAEILLSAVASSKGRAGLDRYYLMLQRLDEEEQQP